MALGKNIKLDKLIPESKKKADVKKMVDKTSKRASNQTEKVLKKGQEKTVEEHQGIRIIIEPSRRKKVKKVTVYLEGEIDIQNAEFLSNKIKEVIATFDIIDVKLREVEGLDLTAIQILYYFTNFYNKGKKTISFHIENLPMNIKTLLVKTKYNKLLFKKPLTSTK